jgi:ankyrin repeat protein
MGKAKVGFKELSEGHDIVKWLPLTPAKEGDTATGQIQVDINLQKGQTLRKKPTMTHSTLFATELREDEHPLFAAIKNNDLQKVRDLLSGPIDVNMKDQFGYTPLHSACCLYSDNDDAILSCLLNHKGLI